MVENLLTCDQCANIFRNKTILKHHIMLKHDTLKYECQDRGKRVRKRKDLHKHIRSRHETFDDREELLRKHDDLLVSLSNQKIKL